MRFFLSILLILTINSSFSQDISELNNLAFQYYYNGQFEKAKSTYENLYNKTKSNYYFEYYINCFKKLNENTEAIKILKSEAKHNAYDLSYRVMLGDFYNNIKEHDKAKSEFEYAIKKLKPDRNQILNLANSFIKIKEYDYAEQVYFKGEKILNTQFNFELASLYQYKRDYKKMIEKYLDVLEFSSSYLQSVQNRLQYTVYNNDDGTIKDELKNSLLRRIQKKSSSTVFNELLIWLYLQDKDYENALTQTIAIDKRLKEDGYRILKIGEISLDNKIYKTAIKAFEYIINEKGKTRYIYEAKNKLLNARFNLLISNNYNNTDLIYLRDEYKKSLNELGRTPETFDQILQLSKIEAFYLNNPEEAQKEIENALKINKITPQQNAILKTTLADILLLEGNFWDATLYYAQVEESFKNNPIGYEAKFKKAKLAFYTGDFKWAQAQLDVLKASTSKLISNDAFSLSKIISDNLSDDDTNTTQLKMYAQADFLFYCKNDSLALLKIDSIIDKYPANSIIDESLYLKAKILISQKKYTESIEILKNIAKSYSYDILADDALYLIAKIYIDVFNDKENANKYFKKLILEHSDSIYVPEARKFINENK